MPNHVLYQHEPNTTLNHFDYLYEKNLKCNTNGISALRHAGINPFHVAIQNRTKESPIALYILLDQTKSQEKINCWFEDEYKKAFEKFRSKANSFNSSHFRLFVATLKPKGDPISTFEYHNPFISEYNNLLQWSDIYNSWVL